MGQKKDSQKSPSTKTAKATAFLGAEAAVDPLLASLFESSAGPVKAPEIKATDYYTSRQRASALQSGDAEEIDEDEDEEMVDVSGDDEEDEDEEEATVSNPKKQSPSNRDDTAGRKRKRGGLDDGLEESYMRKLAKEEAKEEEQRLSDKKGKRRKVIGMEEDREAVSASEEGDEDEDGEEDDDDDDIENKPLLHESLTGSAETTELDKSNRTVFLGNVSTEAIKSKSAKKTLITHLSSFFPSLPESATAHTVESLRFRSTAFSSSAVPKRAAFAKKELMDKTTQSTNAYAVYSTAAAARRAPTALNGTIVLDRHLRVDSVAHPLAVDNKRCIFVGNLGFVDEETRENDDDDKKKKRPTPAADVEEGLWRVFNAHTGPATKNPDGKKPTTSKGKPSKTGNVESVRVVRDPTTRIGKGFAYVQFHDENHVEAALHLDGKRYPPLLPRKLRVVRAKRMAKKRDVTGPAPQGGREHGDGKKDTRSLQGRASRLLGRAGAAKLRNPASTNGAATGANSAPTGVRGSAPASAPLVFEGYRATTDTPKFKIKTKSRGAAAKGGKGKGAKGKPKTRSSRRGAAFKAGGGKKGGGGEK